MLSVGRFHLKIAFSRPFRVNSDCTCSIHENAAKTESGFNPPPAFVGKHRLLVDRITMPPGFSTRPTSFITCTNIRQVTCLLMGCRMHLFSALVYQRSKGKIAGPISCQNSLARHFCSPGSGNGLYGRGSLHAPLISRSSWGLRTKETPMFLRTSAGGPHPPQTKSAQNTCL